MNLIEKFKQEEITLFEISENENYLILKTSLGEFYFLSNEEIKFQLYRLGYPNQMPYYSFYFFIARIMKFKTSADEEYEYCVYTAEASSFALLLFAYQQKSAKSELQPIIPVNNRLNPKLLYHLLSLEMKLNPIIMKKIFSYSSYNYGIEIKDELKNDYLNGLFANNTAISLMTLAYNPDLLIKELPKLYLIKEELKLFILDNNPVRYGIVFIETLIKNNLIDDFYSLEKLQQLYYRTAHYRKNSIIINQYLNKIDPYHGKLVKISSKSKKEYPLYIKPYHNINGKPAIQYNKLETDKLTQYEKIEYYFITSNNLFTKLYEDYSEVCIKKAGISLEELTILDLFNYVLKNQFEEILLNQNYSAKNIMDFISVVENFKPEFAKKLGEKSREHLRIRQIQVYNLVTLKEQQKKCDSSLFDFLEKIGWDENNFKQIITEDPFYLPIQKRKLIELLNSFYSNLGDSEEQKERILKND